MINEIKVLLIDKENSIVVSNREGAFVNLDNQFLANIDFSKYCKNRYSVEYAYVNKTGFLSQGSSFSGDAYNPSNGMFLIRKGSSFNRFANATLVKNKHRYKKWLALLESGLISEDGKFLCDFWFSSSSEAASISLGGHVSGPALYVQRDAYEPNI